MIMTNTRKYSFFILAFSALLIFFHHINEPGFFLDGLIYAGLGKNAVLKGRWLIPYLSDTYYPSFFDHIPFMIMLEGLFFKFFGISFGAARFFVNLFSIGTFFSLMYFVKKYTDYTKSVIILFLFLLTIPLLKHSRHPNFDMPLMMVSFLSISFYLEAFETHLKRHWYLCGIFFGLAMLFKGPMAVFIPLTILFHLFSSKKIALLKNITPWLGLLLGFFLFSLWPLALYFDGKIQIFIEWFKFTILASALQSRGVIKNDYFLYIRHLLMFTPIHIVLLSIAIYKMRLQKYTNFFKVHLIFFLVALTITSMAKFKLSHYIMPLYPSLAIIAGFGIMEFNKFKLPEFLVVFSLIAGLVIFINPSDPKKIRDFEIFEVRNILMQKNLGIESVVDVEGAYPYWSLASLEAFIDGINVYQENSMRAHSLHLVPNAIKEKYSSCEFIYELKRYSSSAYYCNFSR